jgi:hypothetical protein
MFNGIALWLTMPNKSMLVNIVALKMIVHGIEV